MSVNKDNPKGLMSGECCVLKFCWHKQVLTQVSLAVSTAAEKHMWKNTQSLPTKTRVSISIEALVALAEIRANNVATASVSITPVAAWRTLILILKERAHT